MEHKILERMQPYRCSHITFDYAKEGWQESGYRNLRKEVFCREQQMFEGTDEDAIDFHALPIVALDEYMGSLPNVIAGVRIDERQPGVWWGSRLCVSSDYRNHRHFRTHLLFDDDTEHSIFALSIGSALIFKAVTTANYLGCKQFFAHVQTQNERLFQRLHWARVKEVTLDGYPHVLMEADLSHYPPSAFAQALARAV
ncbi:MAG: MSMEG_0567/Sll0786 family nitrogen starvation N-acetyltransferase [Bacteroidota bacterium]